MCYDELVMNEKLAKPYNPHETEPRIYSEWEKEGFFNPDVLVERGVVGEKSPSFSIVMPPPNVTGILHMGHALFLTLEDIMIRYKRMQGFRTLWVPGTDHAAISTQAVLEKEIYKKEGKSRFDLGREEFVKRAEVFAKESHDTIVSQIKIMGASCDWSREAFTLDEKRSLAVRTVFKKMYEDKLIYRGDRIVNWDAKGQTTISDDEIVYQEERTKFYYLKYGPFTIGTARPETKFGDKYVVMHPDDTRYSKYKHGETFDLEWINGPITATIIKDSSIDMKFGTGVMTVTPWHSMADFELAEKYKLDKEQIIDIYGKLLPIAGEFTGIKIKDAREKIVEKLESKGLVERIEEYTHNIATAERTGGTIEPQIMKQWFIDVNKSFVLSHSKIEGIKPGTETTLKEMLRKTVDTQQIEIIPDYFKKTYFHWIDNLRDWCISRQIWYGLRIPVWYRGSDIYVGLEKPKEEGWEQDPDTLDTWFSSGLWTFSTLGWPEDTLDLKTYHPTNILETGYDILFFWVARMILMTGYTLGDVPFHIVYLHGIIRDSKGRKFSKTLGNGIDPIEIAQKFGADAARMSLVVGNTPGTDMALSEDKIKGYKHFSNKVWNITRFVLTNTSDFDSKITPKLTPQNQKNIDEIIELFRDITKDMENLHFHLASEKIYHYIWRTFADVIIEESKNIFLSGNEEEKKSMQYTLFYILEGSLKILHPFMPFITEEIWSILPERKNMLLVEKWPAHTS